MEFYSTLVPHLFSPNSDVYRNLLKEIGAQSGHKHLPKIWTDLQSSNFCGSGADNRMGLSERFAAAMQYADIPIFSDIDDPENDENLKMLKVRLQPYQPMNDWDLERTRLNIKGALKAPINTTKASTNIIFIFRHSR